MPTQIIIILCEGPHDVAFICRILKVNGFRSNESVKLGSYPKPINDILKSEFEKTNVEELNLQEIRNSLLPSNTLILDEKHVFLYSMGGDSKRVVRQNLLKTFRSLIPDEGEISAIPENTNLSILYFLDSDEKGVQQRLLEINEEIIEALDEVDFNLFESNSEIKLVSKLKLGSFIFTGEDNNLGKLEDILNPLMRSENEVMFDEATLFIDNHFNDERLFPLKITLTDGNIVENRSTRRGDRFNFDKGKSLIGIAGQIQNSGSSNVVCIQKSDLLTHEKISNSRKCQEIIIFLDSFINFDTLKH